jgi:hypothetical protein
VLSSHGENPTWKLIQVIILFEKMGPMVHHYGLRNTKPRNNVIEHEKSKWWCPSLEKVGKGLNPFSEVVNNHDDVAMTISPGRITCHEINPPFGKGTNSHHRMKWSRMSTHLTGEYLTRMTFLDHIHTIFEDRGPKYPTCKYISG